MDINRLTTDELSYELHVRGFPSEGNVLQKRKALRDAIRANRLPQVTHLDAFSELNICDQKLLVLREDLVNFDYANKHNEYQRIYSRLIHVSSRLNRIIDSNVRHKQIKLDLTSRCTQLLDVLNSMVELPAPQIGAHASSTIQSSILDEAIPPLFNQSLPAPIDVSSTVIPATANSISNNLIDLEAHESHSPTTLTAAVSYSSQLNSSHTTSVLCTMSRPIMSTSHQNSPRQVRFQIPSSPLDNQCVSDHFSNNSHANLANDLANFHLFETPSVRMQDYGQAAPESYVKYFDISKWPIAKFDGKSNISGFLERIEELRISRGVSKDQLFRSATELFTDSALTWFRWAKSNIFTWDDLITQLKYTFLPSDNDRELWKIINNRKQGATEKVVIYVAAMENYYSKLTRTPPDSERLSTIRDGLLPYLQLRLAGNPMYSISQLVEFCRPIEETVFRLHHQSLSSANMNPLLGSGLTSARQARNHLSEIHVDDRDDTNQVEISVNPQLNLNSNDILSDSNLPSSAIDVSALNTNQGWSNSNNERRVVTCWNCDQPGHRFQQCPQPSKLLCFRCGKVGVTIRNCPVCSGNVNQGR